MARNLVDMVDVDEDVDLFEKLGHSNKRYNNKRDNQEQIKRKRREKQKMRQEAEKEALYE